MLPENVLSYVFELLPVADLLSSCLVCREWNQLSWPQWRSLQSKLLIGKVHFHFQSNDQPSWKRAYGQSLAHGSRKFILLSEMLDGEWWFRFKESAGDEWVSQCRWHNGFSASQLEFKENGVLHRKGKDLASEYAISWKLVWTLNRRDRRATLSSYLRRFKNKVDGSDVEALAQSSGNAIRLHINGCPAPLCCVRRSPTGNWGFVLESCWTFYTSFEMPLRGQSEELEVELIDVDVQQREVNQYNKLAAGPNYY